jgi:glycosyltransferase involved in cell wall biosynthesis
VVSIIIPAHNEELLLGKSVRAAATAAKALGEPFEIVVVDDASTDRTRAVALEEGARIVSISRRQIAASRNAGAGSAQGDHFVFVDADTVIGERVLRGALEAMRAGAAGGGAAFQFDEPRPAYIVFLQPILVFLFRLAGLTGGCFLFATREAFLAAGGFDETLFASEEIAMARALKRQGRFVVLREAVLTSGRKLRAYSLRELFCVLVRLSAGGAGALANRDKLELWYGKRRPDPAGSGR